MQKPENRDVVAPDYIDRNPREPGENELAGAGGSAGASSIGEFGQSPDSRKNLFAYAGGKSRIVKRDASALSGEIVFGALGPTNLHSTAGKRERNRATTSS